MALKYYKPTTPGRRHLVLVDKSSLWKGAPEKSLVTSVIKSNGGRNNLGRITAFNKGGANKKKYRAVDFVRRKDDVEAVVERLEYDPNRTAFIALIKYADGELSYILAPEGLNVGDSVVSSNNVDIKPGNAAPLKNIPIGTIVHNVEMKPMKGGQVARSAGGYVQIIGKDAGYVLVRMRSNEVRLFHAECRATVGTLSNADHQNVVYGKAGRKRWMGVRPTVRGVAMNPVDHPHGGGEGKTSGGRHPSTPWGKYTKGKRTRSAKAVSSRYIVRKRHDKK